MLKITVVEDARQRRLIVEGKLIAPWAVELATAYQTAKADLQTRELIFDPRSLTAISSDEKDVLLQLMISEADADRPHRVINLTVSHPFSHASLIFARIAQIGFRYQRSAFRETSVARHRPEKPPRPCARRRVADSSREQEGGKVPQQRLRLRPAWRPPDLGAIIAPKRERKDMTMCCGENYHSLPAD